MERAVRSELEYYEEVGVKASSPADLVLMIRKGLPFKTVHTFLKRFGPSLEEAQVATDHEIASLLLGVSERTYARRKKEARRLKPVESERLLRTTRLLGLATDLFEGNEDAAWKWLTSPQLGLGDEKPLGYAQTEIGAREVEDLIGRIRHGVVS